MRVAVIGFGAWGRCHARALAGLPGVVLAGILAHGDASAAEAAAEFPGVPVHRDLAGLLASGVEAVDIVAPNHLHEPVALAALAAGKHVLVEKPLALTAEGCARIAAAARTAGRCVSVTHELRVSSQWGLIRREIAAGAIGTPLAGVYTLFRRPFRGGAAGWRHDPARVGSWILEEPVHFFDLLLWYFDGHGNPVSLRAQANGADGLTANLAVTARYASGAFFTVSQILTGFEHHCTLDIGGSAGALRAWWSAAEARATEPVAGLSLQRGAAPPETQGFARSGEIFELTEHLRASIAAFRAGTSPLPAEEASRAVLMCLAAEESCRTGRDVTLSFPPR